MSLYIQKSDEPRNKADYLIAKDEENYVFWTDQQNHKGDNTKTVIYESPTNNIEAIPIIKKNQVYTAYICGAQGSGKTTYSVRLIEQILKEDKSIKNIFYLTSQDFAVDDPALKPLKKHYKIVKIQNKLRSGRIVEKEEKEYLFQYLNIYNPKLYEIPLSDFSDTIFLIDDIDVLPKDIEKLLPEFIRKIITTGRKLNISFLILRHKLQNHNKTAEIILESQNVIVFPQHNRRDSIKFLENYLGFNTKEIHEVKENFHGRILYIRKSIPQFLLSENRIELL